MQRSSGILLHISSLPSPYGIGSFGRAAYEWVDFLAAAGQSYWQVLPMGPTGYGDSPYQSFSTFAGNPYFIDLDTLIEAGLLLPADVTGNWGENPARVDFGLIYARRLGVLRRAYQNALLSEATRHRLTAFSQDNVNWLDDYALFMALKDAFGGRPWSEWPEPLRQRDPSALWAYRAAHQDDIGFHRFVQMLFFEQWFALKRYANERGIQIIGDLPIYVPLDSADVWAKTPLFDLDENRLPRAVAGVPPDYFSDDGQLWGNPLYNWARMQPDGYAWWMERLRQAARLFDALRIDHFRGLASYWAVPYGALTARKGVWLPGPGMDFIRALGRSFPKLPVIAEDLGLMGDDVVALVKESGFPNMKVLQFAFDTAEPSNHLPQYYEENCVCYTGTHDNSTVLGWYEKATPAEQALAAKSLDLRDDEGVSMGFIRAGMASVARLFVAQMQDYLNLGDEARMNLPGTLGGNWQWRMQQGAASPALAKTIADLTRAYKR